MIASCVHRSLPPLWTPLVHWLGSMGDRRLGISTWGLSSMEGEPPELWACGSGSGEQIKWLRFSIFMLWGFKEGKGWSRLQKNIALPVLPAWPVESWLPVGTEGAPPPGRTPPAVSRAFRSHSSWQDDYTMRLRLWLPKQRSFLT